MIVSTVAARCHVAVAVAPPPATGGHLHTVRCQLSLGKARSLGPRGQLQVLIIIAGGLRTGEARLAQTGLVLPEEEVAGGAVGASVEPLAPGGLVLVADLEVGGALAGLTVACGGKRIKLMMEMGIERGLGD